MTDVKEDKFKNVNVGNFRFPFGQYKGKLFKDIPKDYLKWCLEVECFCDPNYKWNKAITSYIEEII